MKIFFVLFGTGLTGIDLDDRDTSTPSTDIPVTKYCPDVELALWTLATMNDVTFRAPFNSGVITGSMKGALRQITPGGKKLKIGSFSGLDRTISNNLSVYRNGKWCPSADKYRTTTVTWHCGDVFRVRSLTEPEECVYEMVAEIPCCDLYTSTAWIQKKLLGRSRSEQNGGMRWEQVVTTIPEMVTSTTMFTSTTVTAFTMSTVLTSTTVESETRGDLSTMETSTKPYTSTTMFTTMYTTTSMYTTSTMQELRNDQETMPCPSKSCWTFNESDLTCTIKPGCVTVDCGATVMKISFTAQLFGIDWNDFSTVAQPAWNSQLFEYELSCNLGGKADECDMTHTVNNGRLVFSVKVAQDGNARTRSNIDVHNRISLGSVTLITSPFTVGVNFQCSYDMEVSLTSNEFTVEDVSMTGTHSNTGQLDAGFTMNLSSNSVILGSIMHVTTTWALQAQFDDLHFYLEQCTIHQGGEEVDIIKGSCLSEVLNTGFAPSPSSIKFCYQTFSIQGVRADKGQMLQCFIQLCMDGHDCKKATVQSQCPSITNEDELMQYSVAGVTDYA